MQKLSWLEHWPFLSAQLCGARRRGRDVNAYELQKKEKYGVRLLDEVCQ